jgi:hypothetical protein
MTAHFDKILFLIGTDCFVDQLFGEFPVQDVEKVKQAARDAVPEMVHGGDNYFMCADFSPVRIQKTQRDFFAKLQTQQVGAGIQQKIHLFYEALQGITDQLRTASHVIASVAARLYWLETDRFKTPITDELLGLIAMVEPLGLDRESHGFEWEDTWLNSPSKWDQFVMSLMDGIDEVPYLTFADITKFSSQFDFLWAWKRHLGEDRFSLIRHYILTEAHAELDSINPDAAKEIDRIMSAI